MHGLTIMSNLFALESIGGGKYIRANNAQFNGFSKNIACKAGGNVFVLFATGEEFLRDKKEDTRFQAKDKRSHLCWNSRARSYC